MRDKRKWARVLAGTMAVGLLATAPLQIYATETSQESSSEGTTSSDTNGNTPPELPSGESGADGGTAENGGTPPEKPEGDDSTNKEAPSGEAPSGEAPSGEAPSGEAGSFGGGANTTTFDYSGSYSGALTADGEEVSSDGETVSTETKDENAALAENGGTLTITNDTLTKSGSDEDGDSCNFYGVNSILLSVGEESMAYVSDTSLSADSTGSNGIFATDSGTVYANNVTIETSESNSRGLDATYGGTIVANLMDIATVGDHCAAIATDRGGGSISATNSTLSTAGSGSPLLYSTGDIQVSNVEGTATGSQIAGMEGLNTILIYNSDLESTITSATASDPVANGVIIYQSTSGDAETTTGERATFNAVDSTLTSSIESGAMFYVTNTAANIVLSGTTLDFDSENVNLLQVEGNDSNSWGTAGSNGGTVTFTAYGETLSGDISVDTISSLDFYLLDGTTYTGAFTITENEVNTNATDSPVIVNVSSDSTWVVTENTTISGLNAEDGATIVDESGKTVTIVANGETVVSGDSDITVTVSGEYSTSVSTDENNELSDSFIERSDFDSYYGTETGFTTLAATVSSTSADSSEDVDTADSNEISAGFIGGILAVAVALLGVVLVMFKKKKK